MPRQRRDSSGKVRFAPDERPPQIKGTLVSFPTVDALLDYYKEFEIEDRAIPESHSSQTYKGLLEWVHGYIKEELDGQEVSWYGEPLPSSVEDANDRTRYQRMDEYEDVYKRIIRPRIEEILKNSKAELEVPVLRYNDLGLGIFDFNKASTGLIPLYKYYSFEKQELVDGVDVEVVRDGKAYKYRLKSDKTPVVLVPKLKQGYDKELVNKAFKEVYDGANVFAVLKKYGFKIGGNDAFSSTIKKTYLLKEKKPKPRNAARIFIKIGGNCNIRYPQYQWGGYAAIGIAELLSFMGYAVSIIGVCGINTSINVGGGKLESGCRYTGVVLKSFSDTLDSSSLLYIASDPTFFRVKYFDVIVKIAQYYSDYMDNSLGSAAEIHQLEDMIFTEYGKRDKLFHNNGKRDDSCQFLYYVLGDIYGEEDVSKAILDIGLDVVNKNIEAREKMGV